MKMYIARILVEHIITPAPKNYSAFSEVIVLGTHHLPKDLEFSQLIFDNRTDILSEIWSNIAKKIDDKYLNANHETVQLLSREIVKIEDTNLRLDLSKCLDIIDERFYTFGETINFEDFKKIYNIGLFSD